TFGVEIELLVKPLPELDSFLMEKGFDRKNRNLIYEGIVSVLSGVSISSKIRDPSKKEPQEFHNWYITYDSSISERPEFYAVELVSPIFSSTNPQEWKESVNAIWMALNANFEVSMDSSCGTHIHVGTPEKFSFEDLKKIAKGTVYYQPALETIMPQGRETKFCKANILESSSLKTAYDDAQRIGYRSLFQWVNDLQDKQALATAMSPNKTVSWNFKNVIENCGTVEFRRPPQVDSELMTRHWIAFTLSM
ncbi:putative amidoligase, partial [Gymnopilus junonius]